MKKLLILGAGYGGLPLAQSLADLQRSHAQWEITLIDQRDYHLIQVRVHEVAANSIPADKVKIPISELIEGRNVTFVQALVLNIDPVGKKVTTSKGTFDFDRLVLALGSVTSFNGIPGMCEYAIPMKYLEDAITFRSSVITAFRESDALLKTEKFVKNDPRLTFVIIGAGLTGTELAAEMVDFCEDLLMRYPALRPYYRIVLIHRSDYLLTQLPRINGEYAKKELRQKGVAILTNSPVTKVEPGKVILQNGKNVRGAVICWSGGVEGPALLKESGFDTTKDLRIPTNPYLCTEQFPYIYAIGDLAFIKNPSTGKPIPQLGQFAERQGHYLAECFKAEMDEVSFEPYKLISLGISISLGRHEAVTLSGPVRLTGLPGRIAKDMSYSKHEFEIRSKPPVLGTR
ncbi:MAG: NAD(P)/FAD-dependent oxidoreductase [Chloroflexi bacterium]|uniref:NAD(P)/FAD-dependent oxidoreductase n=1 Tax=Candidatus Chlorohelix allophototropha TaxID=3003348 RepID=A0A8T7M6Q0_9CHLR|nr:NAD(P)/FAD-dependent oxidoreductase [Chloroflexota bacterium]WJW69611.1 NAD(P)/FAD-dependent oxidoreductase [Chloroflexota bacterium L227-S17]